MEIRRKKQISDLAEYIATEDGDYGIPVNVIKIAEDNDISYSFNDYGNYFDGLLEQEDGHFHIYINDYGKLLKSSVRTRFSFSHELGHYFIDEHRMILENGNSLLHPSFYMMHQKESVEKEADYFASCLLMPEKTFLKFCQNFFSYEIIREIQESFQVSLSAALFRYIDLGAIPITVVCVKKGIIQYDWHSVDFPYPYLNKDYTKKVPLLTCAGDYFTNEVVCDKTEDVDAKEWFRSYDDISELTVHEKCIYQKKFDTTISILWFD